MPSVDDVIARATATLKASPDLAGVKEWHQVNNLITLVSPGISIGLEKENFEPYDKKYDNVNAFLKIFVWVKDMNPVQGEAEVRRLAHHIRSALNQDIYLGGMIDSGFVAGIEYLSGDAGKGLLLHMAELDYQTSFLALRMEREPAPRIDQVQSDTEINQ
ncbi:hypothetical protein [Desulforamulus ruminis]|uniref:Uncharacterized protein n=1 Tax=Desulforamulus ruminis (strain ATCC 23193 / DSM 2154 / NCIMB 8452 / DL) TaxID=696281 RepID=F6DTF8_DESRL|nr:hypothetical protein [Desulforamulus ruminis]AEG60020.1 hypothetical protein Desru_1756 [Desulforamulus ruminis DSM 2154]